MCLQLEQELLAMSQAYERDEEDRGFLDDREKEAWLGKVKEMANKVGAEVARKEKIVLEREVAGCVVEHSDIEGLREATEVVSGMLDLVIQTREIEQ